MKNYIPMTMARTFMLVGSMLATLWLTGASADTAPSVDEIIHRANQTSYYQGKDGRAQVMMTITDSQGRERERRFTILRRDVSDSDDIAGEAYNGDQQFYVFFQRPADVNKMAFLVWKHLGTDDDRWLYLPALDLVKRIAATDQRTSFVGSDYFYEDVSGRDINADTHELLEITDNYYVLKHTPKDPDSVEFSHYVMYVHKTSFIPVQTEYFDKNGEKYRVATALGVDTIDGYPTVTKASMEDLRSGSKTLMSYSAVTYNVGLPEDIFSERYLRRAPVQYLR
ncbi:outer membrane lipoprotein-sorting protein [Porticoccus sp.]